MIKFIFQLLISLVITANCVAQSGNSSKLKRIEVWELDHYQTTPGKIIGIWPNHKRYSPWERLRDLNKKWGFNYLLFSHGYKKEVIENVIKAGFDLKNIMASLQIDNFKEKIDNYGNIFAYYIDEPVKHNHPSYQTLAEYIEENTDAFFVTGDYKRSFYLENYASYADYVMFTSYKNWTYFLGFYIPWGLDQRPSWSDMKEEYPEKFQMTWIGAHRDTLEYEQLLAHAMNLGLKGIWYFQSWDSTDEYSDYNIANFSEAAWKAGWMTKTERKFIYEYICLKPGGCDAESENGWVFNRKIDTGKLRKI